MEGKTRIEKAINELVEAFLERIENESIPDTLVDFCLCPKCKIEYCWYRDTHLNSNKSYYPYYPVTGTITMYSGSKYPKSTSGENDE